VRKFRQKCKKLVSNRNPLSPTWPCSQWPWTRNT